ncbi:TVP38/TMEM64 family protein [Suicoccus acidiformans]|nr:TVP38/TMEM64 family protein [Suicoccus acidiformans]
MYTPTRGDQLTHQLLNVFGLIGIGLTIYLSVKAYQMGLLTDQQAMEDFLQSAGIYGPIIFVIIQFLQTVIPIMPGALTIPAGEIVFGALNGFLLNLFAILVGSVTAFVLCRHYGRRFLWVLLGEDKYQRYVPLLDRPMFHRIFTCGMIVPFAPADILCMLAGVSQMPWKQFLWILFIGKPISLWLYTKFSVLAIEFIVQILQGGLV